MKMISFGELVQHCTFQIILFGTDKEFKWNNADEPFSLMLESEKNACCHFAFEGEKRKKKSMAKELQSWDAFKTNFNQKLNSFLSNRH